MDKSQELSANKLADTLKNDGLNSRLLLAHIHGRVVLRSPGSPWTDVPLPSFEEADLNNAVRLGLLQKGSVVGSYNWDWYVLKRPLAARHADGWYGRWPQTELKSSFGSSRLARFLKRRPLRD